MNKAELIDKMAKDAGVTKTQANDALDSFTNCVVASLKKGDRVTLGHLGEDVLKQFRRGERNNNRLTTLAIINFEMQLSRSR